MIINNIKLENFRQYKGITSIDFATDKDKNVTVIIGQNTGGKTTLVRAFIWCLYGDKSGFKDKTLLNAEVAESLLDGPIGNVGNVSVKITLTHDDKKYVIYRNERYTTTSSRSFKTVSKVEVSRADQFGDLKPLKESEINSTITDILPHELSDYFFFWGERIESLGNKKEIDVAVKNFMGLNTISNTKKHLIAAMKSFQEMVVETETDQDMAVCQSTIKKLEAKTEKLQQRVDQCIAERDYYQSEYDKACEDFYKIKGKQKTQDEIKKKQTALQSKEKQLKQYNENLIKKFNNNMVAFFGQPLANEAKKVIEDNPSESVGWRNIDEKSIDEIIQKHECICGAKIHEGDEAYRHLMSQRSLVAPNVIGALSGGYVISANEKNKFYTTYVEDIEDVFKSIDEVEYDIHTLEDEIKEIQLSAQDESELNRKRIKRDDKQRSLSKANDDLAKAKQDLQLNLDRIKNQRNKLETMISKLNKENKYKKYATYANAVLVDINKDLNEKETEVKTKLQHYSQQYFNEMYTGERIVKINDKFAIETYNFVNGRAIKSETSPGLETVKNFAFIAALVQIAKEKIMLKDTSEGDSIISSEPYPLVLDAPFSQADEKHVPAISKLISNIAEQIILVVMEKDWEYAKNDLIGKVGKYYKLQKKTETHTIVVAEEMN